MKKHIAIAAGLAVLSTSAFATKSRMEALGQGDSKGSYFIQDSRNIFRNAAAVNDMTNYVVTEWGSTAGRNPEGGFFRSAGQFNYGVYLNSDVSAATHTNGTNTGALSEDDRITAFIGGDMGVKWGASLFRASSEDEQTVAHKKEHDSMGVGLGVMSGPLEGFVNFTFKDEAKGNTATAGSKSDADAMEVGLTYQWMSYKFYADYSKNTQKVTNVTANAGTAFDQDVAVITVGVGHTQEVSASSRLFTNIEYLNTKSEEKIALTDDKASKLPLTVGFEADATSWLALRGSVSQVVLLNTEKNKAGKKKSEANTTNVNAGATLNFGKLKVDGMIGTGGNGTETATNAETGSLSLDRLMTRVAVHYWF
ncbi:MAG: hypothetical protein COW01_06590 [Bdellovibrionales bacterium CG12_big_fil_rev_8_21_14_0_65_38_15]|nr:MAG: hypothetical protein COW01_06590 [Bdellovibrionales bacterium CG12_big_fil_rev_8_21_14_0_65_38_15]